ncbi:MAG: hypothetical protein GY869_04875, partial [Planctomycetes bacterium]|nr:hypothetical protein [Planctomycetota bacterium]
FGPTGTNWTINADIIQSDLNGNDYLSIAALPDNSIETLEFYQTYAFAFITDTQVSWQYDENSSTLTTTYQVSATPKEGAETETLLAIYRHQWLRTSTPFTDYSYPSPRGEMKVIAGDQFATEMIYPGILPGLPDAFAASPDYDQSQLESYLQDLLTTPLQHLIPDNDTYYGGKDLGKIAAIVRLADQIGHNAAREYFLFALKTRLENWLEVSDPNETTYLFYYNDTWQTLIGYPAGFGSDSSINDHSFHYGYFIMAAAVVAQYDPEWAAEEN